MFTCKHSWIMGSIICLTIAGCGDAAADASALDEIPSATQALRPAGEASAVRVASQVEFNAMELARLALHRTHDPAMRDFAQKMLDAHTHNRKWLRQAAMPRGFKVATAMDTVGQNLWSKLAFQSGAPFDRAFQSAVRTLQTHGLQSISSLRQVTSQDEIAAWCEAATQTWQTEQAYCHALIAPK